MNTYVAMVRGINVGGQKKVRMDDLRALVAALGHSDVTTYIQSGNVIFRTPMSTPSELAKGIEERVAHDLGLTVTVVLRSADELAQVLDANPFLREGADAGKLHVTFLGEAPDPELLGRVAVPAGDPCEFRAEGREVYLHCPGGYGRTKLDNAFWERQLRVAATTRNWNTVTKLCQLASA